MCAAARNLSRNPSPWRMHAGLRALRPSSDLVSRTNHPRRSYYAALSPGDTFDGVRMKPGNRIESASRCGAHLHDVSC
jgi:hypothetical protein